MSKFNDFRKNIAGRIVSYYRNRVYQKAVAKADRRAADENTTIYVIDHFIKGQTLSCVNRKEFRFIKHSAQKLHKGDQFYSPQYGMKMLREQCWYHTGGLSEKEKEVRRLSFIRDGLKKARLYK